MEKDLTFNQKASAIRAAIELEVDKDDLDGLQGKLLRLVNLIGLSSEIKARAITDLKTAELLAYAKYKSEKLQPSLFKTVIEGETAEHKGKLELADRLNAGIAHAIEGLRTIISLKKTEMEKSI
jgi:hypothetical protein